MIDQTEALVAIDVNSGKSRKARDAETNALNTNLEAVDEICRQLRLRDLGGIIVNDLIDMRPSKNRKKVEQRMRDNLKKDRAKTRVGPISTFGLLEMTRQRMRPSLRKSIHAECRHCAGLGYTQSAESVVLNVMRQLALVMQRDDVARVELTISPDVAFQLLNRKRNELTHLEESHGKQVLVRVGGGRLDYIAIDAYDNRNQSLATEEADTLKNLRKETDKTYRDLDDPDLPETVATVVAEEDDDKQPSIEDQLQDDDDAEEQSEGDGEDKPKKKRRRRRRRRSKSAKSEAEEGGEDSESEDDSSEVEAPSGELSADESTEPSRMAKMTNRRKSDADAAEAAVAVKRRTTTASKASNPPTKHTRRLVAIQRTLQTQARLTQTAHKPTAKSSPSANALADPRNRVRRSPATTQ